MKRAHLFILTTLFNLHVGLATQPSIDKDPNVAPLAPQASLQQLNTLPPYQTDLIAAEPLIHEPICMAWGGDGALYVVELRGYMQDIDHTGAQDPVGRVVRLEDTNGDGKMDQQSVFVDQLVEPRSILAVKGGILVGAPPDIFYCQDTNGDGQADIQKSIFQSFASRNGNVEHKINGLTWGIDNWLYNAKSSKKFQYLPDANGGSFVQKETGFRGQWGITQDDIGNLYGTTNSSPWIGEQIAYDYLLHDHLVYNNTFNRIQKFEEGFKEVWPLVGTPDVQAGPGILRKDNWTLSRFTAIGGQHVFRGDKLGEDMYGAYIIPEPVGRLVRLAHINYDNGYRTLSHPFKDDKVEFMASRDPNFRPVHAYTGPDGCLYIIDMYRGIIQDGNWTRPGSYLRKEILRKGLDKNIQRGRIYRVIKQGLQPGPTPKFDHFTTEQLVQALAHPNGWWRDEAQKRLVMYQDKQAIPDLIDMLKNEASPSAKIHAIWTLHGLGAWDETLAKLTLQSSDWRVVSSAIRASEDLIQRHPSFIKNLKALKTKDVRTDKQLILSLGLCNTTKGVSTDSQRAARELIVQTAMAHPNHELIVLSTLASMPQQEPLLLNAVLKKQASNIQMDSWLLKLSQMIIQSGDIQNVEHLLQATLQLAPASQRVVIKGLAQALPKGGQGANSIIQLIRFEKKTESLQRLEQDHKGPLMKKAMTWFTWPGEAHYDKAHAMAPMADWEQNLYNKGKTIYDNLCHACHGQDGLGIPSPDNQQFLAPALAGNQRVQGKDENVVKVLLHGLTGPLDGKTYSGLMAPMGSNDDEWISSVLTYIRRAWGNVGTTIPHHTVKRIREKNKLRKTPWTEKELQ